MGYKAVLIACLLLGVLLVCSQAADPTKATDQDAAAAQGTGVHEDQWGWGGGGWGGRGWGGGGWGGRGWGGGGWGVSIF
ncbi:hypothetical protein M569_15418 [Genlisea aurea]|uniref:Glycine-rich protein n=1 Tax=Genlisea aurea TaxID=192259 RepID=S8BXU5_9LAMI|nr:hypothetical protein M569_15418 [Genlisea aurea]